MEFTIDKRYSTFSTSIVFYLLHNNEDYNNLWIENLPELENQCKNFFKDEKCGCRPPLMQNYLKFKFEIDRFTVDFLNRKEVDFDFDDFCSNHGSQNLRGTVFSVDNTIAAYKDLMASVQQKNASFNFFTSIIIEDKIVISFF